MSIKLDTLLIIDDIKADLLWFSEMFSPYFKCLTATSGEKGLDIFNSESPYMILCDVKMPGGMSGFKVSKKIKLKSPKTIVILISSYGDTQTKKDGYAAKADIYIDKEDDDDMIIMKVINLYNTSKGNLAEFPESYTDGDTKNIDNFELNIKNILSKYYNTSVHSGRPKEITFNDIVEKLGRGSNRTIQRIFKTKIGKTFTEYHKYFKLKFAADLLITTSDPIKDIVETVNYASHSSFAREFKELYKVTPTKYRLNYKKSTD